MKLILIVLSILFLIKCQVPIFNDYSINLEYETYNTINGIGFKNNISCLVGKNNNTYPINLKYINNSTILGYLKYNSNIIINFIVCTNDGIHWSEEERVFITPHLTGISEKIITDSSTHLVYLFGLGFPNFYDNFEMGRVRFIYPNGQHTLPMIVVNETTVGFTNPKIEYNGTIIVYASNDACTYSSSNISYINIYSYPPNYHISGDVTIIIIFSIFVIFLVFFLILRSRNRIKQNKINDVLYL